MKILCISDTHNKHQKLTLPDCDVLIHAGDFSGKGREKEIHVFLDWLASEKVPGTHKIFIAGNHDFGMESEERYSYEKKALELGLIYLNDSGVEIDGVKFWGSPITPWFHDWAFNRNRGTEIRKHWELIPNDTDVLITHGPPFGVLDKTWRGQNVGCEELAKIILDEKKISKLKLHVFGHIHEDKGINQREGIKFINASSVNLNPFSGKLDFFEVNLTL